MKRVLGIGAVVSGLAAAPAYALEADYGLGYGGLYSDNIGLTHTNQQSEYINMFRGLFSLQENTDRIDAKLFSLLELRQYTQTNANDEALFALDGSGRFVISPRQLSFIVTDRFTQVPIVPTAAVGPTNRQNANVLSLGPDGTLHLTHLDTIEAGGRLENYYFQTANAGSDRLTGYARLTHLVSPFTRVGANYEPSYVRFHDQTLNPNYFRQDVFGRASTRHLGLDMNADVGRTFITRKAPSRNVQGRIIRLGFTRQTNADTFYNLTLGDELSDSGRDLLVVDPSVVGTPPPSAVPSQTAVNATDFVSGGLYANQHVDISFNHRRYYGNDIIRAYRRTLDFESPQVLLDQTITGAFADIGYDYSAAMTTAVFGNVSKTEYSLVNRVDRDYGLGGRLVYRFMRTLSLVFETRYSQRQSTIQPFSYKELRAVASVAYNTNYAMTVNNPFLEQNNPLYR